MKKSIVALLLLLPFFAGGTEVVLDAGGKPTGNRGSKPGVPVWGFSTVYAEGERFVILY